jgi:MFS family permease
MRIAVVNALGELMAAVAPLLGGAIADHWSYAALYEVAMGCSILAAGVMWTRARRAVPRSAAAC